MKKMNEDECHASCPRRDDGAHAQANAGTFSWAQGRASLDGASTCALAEYYRTCTHVRLACRYLQNVSNNHRRVDREN